MAENISNMMTTLTKVADEKHPPSLNAAIEVEKDDEFNCGMSVAAMEIRRLTDPTAAATSGIDQTGKETQSATSASVMGVDKSAQKIRRGVGVVHQVGEAGSQVMRPVQTRTPSFETPSGGAVSVPWECSRLAILSCPTE